MAPFYTFGYPPSLSPDDRRGIQHLYGRPRPAPSPRPPTLGPQSGVDTNEIAPLEVRCWRVGRQEVRPCTSSSTLDVYDSNVASFLALSPTASRRLHQTPARSPLTR